MFIRLLLVIAILAALFYSIRYIRAQPKERQGKLWLQTIAIGAALTLLLMAITGRLHWIGIALAGSIPALRALLLFGGKFMPVLGPWLQKKMASQPEEKPAKSANTEYLQFVVDSNGDMGGLVLRGSLAGKQLHQLNEAELGQCLEEFKYCADSLSLLKAYIHKYHPAMEQPSGRSSSKSSSKTAQGHLSKEQAEQILGLTPPYANDDVVQAHRRLMQKMHPDRGGSDFLAAQINSAKDRLLGD